MAPDLWREDEIRTPSWPRTLRRQRWLLKKRDARDQDLHIYQICVEFTFMPQAGFMRFVIDLLILVYSIVVTERVEKAHSYI